MDYNFVSVEEFFSLEESGALLESGKFKGQSFSHGANRNKKRVVDKFVVLQRRGHVKSLDTAFILILM